MSVHALSQRLQARLQDRLGPQGVLLAAADKASYEASARHAGGHAQGVVRPATLEELSWCVRTLAEAGCAIVAQGAATGLVGAATPSAEGSQWVVSTQRLRDRLQLDPQHRSVTVSAGYRLSEIQRAAAEHGLTFALDLSADPSVGGMVATNTGGSRLIRWGGVRDNLLGAQAVLVHPPGQTVGSLRGLRKDNTGLDWAQLLSGSFGAFGIVARAVLRLHPVQKQIATALVAVESVPVAMALLESLEDRLGDFVSAFEGMSAHAMHAALSHLPGATRPFAGGCEYAVLIELTSAVPRDTGLDLDALLLQWLEGRLQERGVLDAVVDKPDRLWRIRHAISESVQALGQLVAFDVAVKRSSFAAFRAQALETVRATLPQAHVCDFGHLGDGGIHLNLVLPPGSDAQRIGLLRTRIYDLVVHTFGGSYSAEHGIGPYNQEYYERYTAPSTRALAGVLHEHVDPHRRLGNVRLD
jgi:FAD/FMN-containing dehydrogenase